MLIFAKGWSLEKDGPGHRLVFYLKGCNLRCVYCGNPESMAPHPELLFYPGRKSDIPPERCCKDGRMNCRECDTYECVRLWHHPAFELAGEEIATEDVLRDCEDSRRVFGLRGGVTFGGGEPLMQYPALAAAIDLLRDHRISVAVESNASLTAYENLIGRVDYLISDCKAIDEALHIRMTGCSNRDILRHLTLAAENQKQFLIRVTLIPQYNAVPDELKHYCEFLGSLNELRMRKFGTPLTVQTLRLHHLGAPKYQALHRTEPVADIPPPSRESESAFQRALQSLGIEILP